MPLSPWANIRMALIAGWCLWALLTFEQLDLFTLLAPISLIYAIAVRIVFWRRPDESTPFIYVCLVVDLGLLLALIYQHGSCSTWLVFVYAPFIAGHAIDTHRGTGRTVLFVAILGILAVVFSEAHGLLPARQGGPASLGPNVGPLELLLTMWPVVVPMTGVYFIMRSAMGRIGGFFRAERERAQAEQLAQQRALQLEKRLLEAERFESLGRLAGGVAHDFNNILTGILGFTQSVHQELPPGHQHREDLALAIGAAERAGELTKQLLTFSRKQVIRSRPVELNTCIEQLKRMLERIIGEDIVFSIELDDEVGFIMADISQLEQVIVNLAVNARDAMPHGGKLTILTSRVTLDERRAKELRGIEPGDYVQLLVRDSGQGMAPETAQKIFEPFFTTKPQGKGTGLGLATVFGIVKQNRGEIQVASQPGRGTTFTVLWPRTEPPAEPAPREASKAPSGQETVLLVEDEEIVRRLACRLLEQAGYAVMVAKSGAQALELLEGHQGRVDLLLTDVVMPGIQGDRLAALVRERAPGIGVLFMSGYTRDAIGDGVLEPGTNFLPKPFNRDALLQAVRQVLDAT